MEEVVVICAGCDGNDTMFYSVLYMEKLSGQQCHSRHISLKIPSFFSFHSKITTFSQKYLNVKTTTTKYEHL